MNRPRRDEIDPMVPELTTDPYRADGGISVDKSGAITSDSTGAEAPLVPDLS